MIAPLVVVTTVIVFASGIVLLFLGPRDRGPWVSIHKVSFIAWLVFTALHVLGHLPRVGRLLGLPRSGSGEHDPTLAGGDGAVGRWIALAGAVVAGAVLAIVLIPHFGLWTAPGAFPHHHHVERVPATRSSGCPPRAVRGRAADSLSCSSAQLQLDAQVQASNPSAVAFGAEGAPITLPFESIRSSSSEDLRLAGWPLVVAEPNAGFERFGSAAKPAFVPISSGVSSIHSAVAWVEL